MYSHLIFCDFYAISHFTFHLKFLSYLLFLSLNDFILDPLQVYKLFQYLHVNCVAHCLCLLFDFSWVIFWCNVFQSASFIFLWCSKVFFWGLLHLYFLGIIICCFVVAGEAGWAQNHLNTVYLFNSSFEMFGCMYKMKY